VILDGYGGLALTRLHGIVTLPQVQSLSELWVSSHMLLSKDRIGDSQAVPAFLHFCSQRLQILASFIKRRREMP